MAAPRLVVEVPWGPHAGSKVAVAPGDRLRVGRTDRADLVISRDEQLSPVHFELAWDGKVCHVRELEPATSAAADEAAPRGTRIRVDGRPAAEGRMGDGGWVRAGDTDFVLHVEGSAEGDQERDAPDDEAEDPAARFFARQARERERARRAAIARQLRDVARAERLYAVLDAARDDRILAFLRSAVDQASSLYDGVQGDALGELAPRLCRIDPASPLLERIVLGGWGARWGIFLTSAQPFKDVRRHLRRFLMVEDDRTGESLYFRFYDPEVLGAFLPSCLPRQAEELFSDVDAFLFEGGDGALVRMDRAAVAAAKEQDG